MDMGIKTASVRCSHLSNTCEDVKMTFCIVSSGGLNSISCLIELCSLHSIVTHITEHVSSFRFVPTFSHKDTVISPQLSCTLSFPVTLHTQYGWMSGKNCAVKNEDDDDNGESVTAEMNSTRVHAHVSACRLYVRVGVMCQRARRLVIVYSVSLCHSGLW